MKKISLILCILLGAFVGCKHSSDPEPEPDPLINTWTVNSVSLDGVFVTSYYNDLKLTFATNGSLTVENPVPPVWNATGSYTVANNKITRNDGMVIDILSISPSKMSLQFQYTAATGRVNSVSGLYKFEFTAN